MKRIRAEKWKRAGLQNERVIQRDIVMVLILRNGKTTLPNNYQ